MNLFRLNQFILLTIFHLFFSCGKTDPTNQDKEKTAESSALEKQPVDSTKVIVFYGNSLTAGYGLKPEEAFPYLIQRKIDSASLNYKVVNAGVSGETSAGGLGRINWILKQKMDVFVLELGANDGLRGLDLKQTETNLQAIIDSVKKAKPQAKILLAGMQIPPSMGKDYSEKFKNIYPRLAESNNVNLIPFLLEGAAGEVKFNQEDGIHPNVEGQKIVADNVWAVLRHVL